jgi:tryptophan synthase beta chain
VILTALCGHAHLDLPAYAAYLGGAMSDRELTPDEIAEALKDLPSTVR